MGKTAHPTYTTGGSWLIKTIFQVKIWEFVLTVESIHNLWPRGLLPQVPSPLNLTPAAAVVLLSLSLRPFSAATTAAQGRKNCLSEFHVPLNTHDHNSYPHVYTECEENKIQQQSCIHTFDEWIAVSTSQKQNEPYFKFYWNAETDDATHRPRGFPKNMEEGIQLPTFLINLHCPGKLVICGVSNLWRTKLDRIKRPFVQT